MADISAEQAREAVDEGEHYNGNPEPFRLIRAYIAQTERQPAPKDWLAKNMFPPEDTKEVEVADDVGAARAKLANCLGDFAAANRLDDEFCNAIDKRVQALHRATDAHITDLLREVAELHGDVDTLEKSWREQCIRAEKAERERDDWRREALDSRERNAQLKTDIDALRKAIRDIEGMDCGTASPSAQLDAACQIAAEALEEK